MTKEKEREKQFLKIEIILRILSKHNAVKLKASKIILRSSYLYFSFKSAAFSLGAPLRSPSLQRRTDLSPCPLLPKLLPPRAMPTGRF
jgi:hypothetical protein